MAAQAAECIDLCYSSDVDFGPLLDSETLPSRPTTAFTTARAVHHDQLLSNLSSDDFNLPTQGRRRPRQNSKQDDIEIDANPAPSKRAKASLPDLTSDPIEFSSSAPLPLRSRADQGILGSQEDFLSDSDLDFDGPIVPRRQKSGSDVKSKPVLSTSTSALLAELDRSRSTSQSTNTKPKNNVAKRPRVKDQQSASQPVTARERPQPKLNEDKIRKAAEREEARRTKELEKAAIAAEKAKLAELADANRGHDDKKLAVKDIIVDIPACPEDDERFADLKAKLQQSEIVHETRLSRVENVITWRRKSRVAFDEEQQIWVPRPEVIEQLKTIVTVLKAAELVKMACPQPAGTHDDLQTLETHLARLLSSYPDCKIVYVIQGLDDFRRKSRLAKNRQYQAAVREGISLSQLNSAFNSQETPKSTTATEASELPASTQARRRKTTAKSKPPEPVLDDEVLELSLLKLQVQHNCLINHTQDSAESAALVAKISEELSIVPYRALRSSTSSLARTNSGKMPIHAIDDYEPGFCTQTGQIRTATTSEEILIQMLLQLLRVTPSTAHGIVKQYSSVQKLNSAFLRNGPLALENVGKLVGAEEKGKVGAALSKRLHKVFTGTDWRSMDV